MNKKLNGSNFELSQYHMHMPSCDKSPSMTFWAISGYPPYAFHQHLRFEWIGGPWIPYQKEMNLYFVIVFEAKNQKVISSIRNKADLIQNYPDSVNIFHSWRDVCYNYYDYEKWLNLKSTAETPEVGYEVPYKLSFEPYFLGEVSNWYWFNG